MLLELLVLRFLLATAVCVIWQPALVGTLKPAARVRLHLMICRLVAPWLQLQRQNKQDKLDHLTIKVKLDSLIFEAYTELLSRE